MLILSNLAVTSEIYDYLDKGIPVYWVTFNTTVASYLAQVYEWARSTPMLVFLNANDSAIRSMLTEPPSIRYYPGFLHSDKSLWEPNSVTLEGLSILGGIGLVGDEALLEMKLSLDDFTESRVIYEITQADYGNITNERDGRVVWRSIYALSNKR